MFFGNRHRKNFRRAAKLALFAILLQALLPLIHHPAQAAPYGVHICAVMHHADHSSDQDKAPVSKSSCPICVSLHLLGSGFVSPTVDASFVIFRDSQTILAYDEKIAVRQITWPGIRSRAPPAFA
jgi:hypothetical protein